MLRWAEIYLGRLLRNYLEIKKLAGTKGIYAVVKANAYGHGSVEVSRALQDNTDVSGFAVATYEEAEELRAAGISREILVMASPLEEGRESVVELKLTPVVYDEEELRLAKDMGIPFHVKVDTGMGRLGFLQSRWDWLLSELKDSKVSGVMTHFSSADEDPSFTLEQFRVFKAFVEKLTFLKPELKVHCDNSSALKFKFDSLLTHSRVGLALYGASSDFPGSLKQVMEVKAKVISVKELPPGFPVSYSKTYRTSGRERVAVVAFGYADGLLRSLSNRGYVLIKGRKAPIRGRVCMDMTVVSVWEGVKKGDVAVISSPDLPFTEIASLAGTIPYELMCDISRRVKRVYVGEDIPAGKEAVGSG